MLSIGNLVVVNEFIAKAIGIKQRAGMIIDVIELKGELSYEVLIGNEKWWLFDYELEILK